MKFYEDPVYIEMCRKAGEIQDDKPRITYLNGYRYGKVAISQFGDYWLCEDDGIFIPRLDQLIEMLDIPLQKLLTDIYHWDCGGLGAGWPTGMDHSWEVMFLGYLMMQKHGKSWDFEKREWVNIQKQNPYDKFPFKDPIGEEIWKREHGEE